MPEYRVTLEGRMREEWIVEADNAEDAMARLRSGQGRWEGQDWVDNPQPTSIVEASAE